MNAVFHNARPIACSTIGRHAATQINSLQVVTRATTIQSAAAKRQLQTRQASSWHRNHSTATNKGSTPNGNRKAAFPLSVAVGTIAGIAGSLAGMGGGFVMIPFMTSRRILALTQHQAHATSLFAVTCTGLAGAYSYGDQVDWEAAAAIAASGMLSARMGALLTRYISGRTLQRALGVLMLVISPIIPLRAHLMEQHATIEGVQDGADAQDSRDETTSDTQPTELMATSAYSSLSQAEHFRERLLPSAIIGIGSGLSAGIFGGGGGVIVVPALAITLGMNHYQALATSLAAMSLPAAVGTYTHYTAGNVTMRVAPGLAIGAFAGAYIGGKLSVEVPESSLRWGFTGVIGTLGLRALFKTG